MTDRRSQPLSRQQRERVASQHRAVVTERRPCADAVPHEFPVYGLGHPFVRSEQREDKVRRQEWALRLHAGRCPVAAPAPVFRSHYDAGSDGVEHDIAADLEEIFVPIDQARGEASLKHVAHGLPRAVQFLRENAVKLPHSGGEVGFRRLDVKMIMVVHLTLGVADPIEIAHHGGEDVIEHEPLIIAPEDGRAAVSAAGDVVEGSVVFYPQRSGHSGGSIATRPISASPGQNVMIQDLTPYTINHMPERYRPDMEEIAEAEKRAALERAKTAPSMRRVEGADLPANEAVTEIVGRADTIPSMQQIGEAEKAAAQAGQEAITEARRVINEMEERLNRIDFENIRREEFDQAVDALDSKSELQKITDEDVEAAVDKARTETAEERREYARRTDEIAEKAHGDFGKITGKDIDALIEGLGETEKPGE